MEMMASPAQAVQTAAPKTAPRWLPPLLALPPVAAYAVLAAMYPALAESIARFAGYFALFLALPSLALGLALPLGQRSRAESFFMGYPAAQVLLFLLIFFGGKYGAPWIPAALPAASLAALPLLLRAKRARLAPALGAGEFWMIAATLTLATALCFIKFVTFPMPTPGHPAVFYQDDTGTAAFVWSAVNAIQYGVPYALPWAAGFPDYPYHRIYHYIYGFATFAFGIDPVEQIMAGSRVLEQVCLLFSNAIERLRTSTALRRSESLARAILDSLPAFICVLDRRGALTMTWRKLPLFVWSLYATGWIQVLATPILGITALLIFAERVLHLGLFNPAQGGDPLLYQHLFWIYSHPAVYIMLEAALGVSYRGLTLRYSREDAPLGTGGALALALARHPSPLALVINGDSLIEADLRAFMEWFAQRPARGEAGALLLAHVAEASRYGRVAVDCAGAVTGFVEKGQSGPGFISAGVYLLRPESLEGLQPGRAASMEQDVFPALAAAGRLCALETRARFLDIGTPESYAEAGRFLLGPDKEQRFSRAAVFLDRDGTVIAQKHYMSSTRDTRTSMRSRRGSLCSTTKTCSPGRSETAVGTWMRSSLTGGLPLPGPLPGHWRFWPLRPWPWRPGRRVPRRRASSRWWR